MIAVSDRDERRLIATVSASRYRALFPAATPATISVTLADFGFGRLLVCRFRGSSFRQFGS
jgi:hypothetical protein